MKRRWLTAALTAAVCLTLVACGSSGGESTPSASEPMPEEPSVSVVAPVEPEPAPEPEPVPEPEPEPVLPYTNPLTGEGCETDIGANRPVAIMLNNHRKALPQLGISQADVIYEMVAEGGITRMMGVFQSVEGVGQIGSVRSARDYYVSLAYGHDAIFLHAGGSDQAYIAIKSLGVTALDCVNGPYEGSLYWRDKNRRANMGLEHSVVTSGETIEKLFPTYTKLRQVHKDGFEVGWNFGQDHAPAGFEEARELKVKFSGSKTGVFTYDGETGLYQVSQHGAPHVDGNTGEQLAVKNVLVLYTDVEAIKGDDKGRQTIRTTGTGDGLMLWEGCLYHITWKRPAESDRFSFYLADGQEAMLSIGSSYINIVDESSEVSWK